MQELLSVENHIVVNSPKYIETFEDRYILTGYALTHMDECALHKDFICKKVAFCDHLRSRSLSSLEGNFRKLDRLEAAFYR